MTRRIRVSVLGFIAVVVLASAVRIDAAADITGTWTSSFDTQIGKQNYTYELVAKGAALTGKIKSDNGASDVLEGKVDGDKVSFVELLKFQDMDIRITYSGTVVSADEIKFTRQVGEFATEELVSKRVKQ